MRRQVSQHQPLRGRRVLVVATLPEEDTDHETPSRRAQRDNAVLYETPIAVEAEEALISTIRAVLAAGGTLDLVVDAPMALLGAMVAGEYFEAEPIERVGSDKSRSEFPALVRILALAGADEALDPFASTGSADLQSAQDAISAVEALAEADAALVCLGGAPMLACVEAFRRRHEKAPIFTYALTGNAAAALVESPTVRAVDLEIANEPPPRSKRDEPEERPGFRGRERAEELQAIDAEFQFSPAPLIAQLIVEEIARQG